MRFTSSINWKTHVILYSDSEVKRLLSRLSYITLLSRFKQMMKFYNLGRNNNIQRFQLNVLLFVPQTLRARKILQLFRLLPRRPHWTYRCGIFRKRFAGKWNLTNWKYKNLKYCKNLFSYYIYLSAIIMYYFILFVFNISLRN